MFRRFGAALQSTHTPAELLDVTVRAEELGFSSFWLAEHYHDRSGPPLIAHLGAATSHIQLGLGVLPTLTRHPALTAMEAATLDELTGGRLLLGLGVGRRFASGHAPGISLARSLEESLPIVRQLLRGEECSFAGDIFSLDATRLAFPPRRNIPIYVGCYPFSPRALRTAGALADGVLYVWTTPELVRSAQEHLAAGAAATGRELTQFDVAAYIIMSVDEDESAARRACRPAVAAYTGIAHAVWRRAGLVTADDVDPVLQALERGGVSAGAAAVSDRLLDAVAIAGNPATCRDRVREYVGTGLTHPVAYRVFGPDWSHSLAILAQDVL